MPQTEAECVARAAYDNPDADWFYSQIWGGQDIHLGLYREPGESIAVASRRTMDHLVGKLGERAVSDVVDLGSGYCGAARFLSSRYGASVLAVNVSREQNQRARALNGEAGMGKDITVTEGTYNSVPAEDASFDLAWSQDAFLHSDRRDVAVAEAARVLRPGGDLLFTDPRSDYLQHMMRGLQNWVDAGSRGLLAWGIFHFRKP